MIVFPTPPELRSQICQAILEKLPAWFGDARAREKYITEAAELTMIAFETETVVKGFASLKIHSATHAEISVMGVAPNWHRQRIGTAIITASRDWAVEQGAHFLSVKTVSGKSPDTKYAQTREFYAAQGFEPFEEFPTLWGTHNPCLLMLSNVRSPKEIGL